MNRFPFLCALVLGAFAVSANAQNVPPVVNAQVADFTVYAGAPARSLDTAPLFSDPDVSDAVTFATDLGEFNVALFGQQKPVTVANFLKYVDQGRYFIFDTGAGGTASSFVHRVVPGFVIQGGSWLGTINPNNQAIQPTEVAPFPPIQSEPGISNKRGTIAMAQAGTDPNSATCQWFINLADNGGPPNNLDIRSNNVGPYAVFGRVTSGMNVVDAISVVPRYNFSGVHPSFANLPLRNWDGTRVYVPNLVSIPFLFRIPVLSLSALTDNSNIEISSSGPRLLITGKNPGTTHITLTATDLDGESVSQQFTVTVLPAPGRPVNLSTRMQVGTGDNALIAGFIMRGAASKRLAVRAIGPSTGLANTLSNPTLELRDSAGATIASNDNWGDAANKQEVIDVGLNPPLASESVILTTVPSNDNGVAYTAIMRGVNNTTGLGVVEVYDLDSGPGSTLLNISTRGQVGVDPNALIGGFILGGTESKQILVRAVGPSLTAFGISNALADPRLELRNQNGDLVDSNDDWMNSPQKAQIQSSGVAPTNAKESAVLQTLSGGAYTAIVRGVSGGTGVGSVEVYQLP